MDPILLVFIAGALFGVAVTLLARLVPDIIFIAKYIAARRRRDPTKRQVLLP